MGLAGAGFRVVEAGDLPHLEGGALVEGNLDGGVGGLPGVDQAGVVGEPHLTEQGGVDVGGGLFAPRQRIEPVVVQVFEQGRGPAAPVEPDQHPPLVADRLTQSR